MYILGLHQVDSGVLKIPIKKSTAMLTKTYPQDKAQSTTTIFPGFAARFAVFFGTPPPLMYARWLTPQARRSSYTFSKVRP